MLYRIEEVGSKLPRPNSDLMEIMNEDMDFFIPPKSFCEPGTHGYTKKHDRDTLFSDHLGARNVRFFFKERGCHLETVLEELKDRGYEHMLFGYEPNERDGEIIYEDNWQVAIKFKNDQNHMYRNLITEEAA